MMHVCQLFLLKFLNLNGTDISKMPVGIGKLTDLQTLSLRDTCLAGLPVSVTKLKNLEFLYFSSRSSGHGWRLPCGLCEMKALRVLDRATLYDDGAEAAREIRELTQLRKLNISVECSQEVLQVLVAALSKTNFLRQLSIVDLRDGKITNNILGKMTSPPLLLQSMRICGEFDGMREWFGSLMRLVKLDISRTMLSSDEILGILCKLPNLLRLTLGYKSYTNDALVISAEYRFPMLQQLNLDNSYAEQEEIIFERGSMAMLEKLEVEFGYEEKSLSGIEHLPSLKEVVLVGHESNDTLNQAVLQLKSESERRPAPNQFKVVARYYGKGGN